MADANSPFTRCYTVCLRPDPPDAIVSPSDVLWLHRLADSFLEMEGVQEVNREARDYQIVAVFAVANSDHYGGFG